MKRVKVLFHNHHNQLLINYIIIIIITVVSCTVEFVSMYCLFIIVVVSVFIANNKEHLFIVFGSLVQEINSYITK